MCFCDKIITYIVWKVLMIKYLKGYQNAGREIEERLSIDKEEFFFKKI